MAVRVKDVAQAKRIMAMLQEDLHRRLSTPYASEKLLKSMVEEIKAPAMEALHLFRTGNPIKMLRGLFKLRHAVKAFAQFPEPTNNNTWNPNSHRLVKVRDELLRNVFMRPLRLPINFAIVIHDYDPPYRMMMDWVKAEIEKRGGLSHLAEVRNEFFRHCVGLAPERLKTLRLMFNLGILAYRSPLRSIMTFWEDRLNGNWEYGIPYKIIMLDEWDHWWIPDLEKEKA